jgi:hypothetical protein
MLSQEIVYRNEFAVHHKSCERLWNQANDCAISGKAKEVVMSIEEVFSRPPATTAPPLVIDAFGNRAILEMEMALTKACEILPRELDNHKNRCFIAKKILKRVNAGEYTFGGMVCAGMAAVEELRRKRGQV